MVVPLSECTIKVKRVIFLTIHNRYEKPRLIIALQ